jgi:hypothetical protein
VNGQIDTAIEQRLLNSLGKDAARSDFFDRPSAVDIAVRGDFDKLHAVAMPPELRTYPFSLPASELAAPRSES